MSTRTQQAHVLWFATENAKKVREIREILEPLGVTVRTIADLDEPLEVEESGGTLSDNAWIKATALSHRTGEPALADDSGLVVDALAGAPGVRSKRFSPEATTEANNRLLLQKLAGVTDRRARFVCAIAVVNGPRRAVVHGVCEGSIGEAPRGEQGFGYDPLFLPDETPGRSMAELASAEKHAISHRGRALAQLDALLGAVGMSLGPTSAP